MTSRVDAVRVCLRRMWRGPWRAACAGDSMRPALVPGDFLLLDPTTSAWPRRGAVVVIREPGSDLLAIKRVAGRPGDIVIDAGARRALGAGDAWLLGDAPPVSIDSRAYGPVSLDRLVARAWLRYWPPGRIGRIGRPEDAEGGGGNIGGDTDPVAGAP